MSADTNSERAINLGPNSVWAKFQMREASGAALPYQAVIRGRFPDSGTSLFMPNRQLREDNGWRRWTAINQELAQRHPDYLEEIKRKSIVKRQVRHLQRDLSELPPEVVKSLIKRGKTPIQPEHLPLFIEEAVMELPTEIQEKAYLDSERLFCRRKVYDSEMDSRLKKTGFIPLVSFESPGDKQAERYGLRISMFNGRAYTTQDALEEFRRRVRHDTTLLAEGYVALWKNTPPSVYHTVTVRFKRFLLYRESRPYIKPEILEDILKLIGNITQSTKSKTTPGFVSAISIAKTAADYKRLVRAGQAGKIELVDEKKENSGSNIPRFFVDPIEAQDYLESHPGYKK